jgi:hypothetical protein
MSKPRPPQLALRLDAAAPDADALWRAGGRIAYLGGTLTLRLDTDRRLPEQVGGELHLPLPPAATPRQIRDAAESWLRDEALRIFAQKSVPAGRCPPRIVLSFGKRGDWVKREGDLLRCHWRLVEQPMHVIEQTLAGTRAAARPEPHCDDLFALA